MTELEHIPDDRRTGFTMPLENIETPPVQMVTAEPNSHTCVACGREVTMIRLTTLEEPELGHPANWTDGVAWRRTAWQPRSHWWMFRWGHTADETPVCQDWVGPVLREVEKRLREFDREGRERGLPGPLQRDPSEPIVVEVRWSRIVP